MKIYLVEDEKDLSEIIRKYLEKEGFEVSVFYDGETAMERIEDDVNLWILDIMLPGETSGYDLMKALNEKKKDTSVIFTSARDQDLDKVIGLVLGSDDYLAKPYSPKELILRVKAILRRTISAQPEIIFHDNYEINVSKREVKDNGVNIELTNKEFELLSIFLNNINVSFKRDEILNEVWGSDYYGSARVADDLLRRLRQKMPNLRIETIYGYGYKLL